MPLSTGQHASGGDEQASRVDAVELVRQLQDLVTEHEAAADVAAEALSALSWDQLQTVQVHDTSLVIRTPSWRMQTSCITRTSSAHDSETSISPCKPSHTEDSISLFRILSLIEQEFKWSDEPCVLTDNPTNAVIDCAGQVRPRAAVRLHPHHSLPNLGPLRKGPGWKCPGGARGR